MAFWSDEEVQESLGEPYKVKVTRRDRKSLMSGVRSFTRGTASSALDLPDG